MTVLCAKCHECGETHPSTGMGECDKCGKAGPTVLCGPPVLSRSSAPDAAALRGARLEEALEAITGALDAPRNRFGKLTPDPAQVEPLRKLAVRYAVGGCEDTVDQAVKVARAALRGTGR